MSENICVGCQKTECCGKWESIVFWLNRLLLFSLYFVFVLSEVYTKECLVGIYYYQGSSGSLLYIPLLTLWCLENLFLKSYQVLFETVLPVGRILIYSDYTLHLWFDNSLN